MIGTGVFGQAQQTQQQAASTYGNLANFQPTAMQAAQLADPEAYYQAKYNLKKTK